MTKFIANSASRALGLVISKFKIAGGLPYKVFTKLYDTIVWPTIGYGSAIYGERKNIRALTLYKIEHRFFLTVGKYTPNNGVNGDMGWTPPHIKQWKSVLKLEIRMKSMEVTRLKSKVYIWAEGKGGNNGRNWTFRLKQHMRKYNFSNDNFISNRTVEELEERMFNVFKGEWKEKVVSDQGVRPYQRDKLRTYRLFKREYCTEPYVEEVLNRQHRSALAKLRCGVAPLKIETGRYERIPHDQRFCFNCANKVEDEIAF